MASTAALDLIIKLNDQASAGLDQVAGKAGMLQQAFSFAAGGLIASGVQAATSAVGNLVSGTIDAAAEFESTLNRFSSVAGSSLAAAGMEVSDFSDLFLEMGAKTQFSAGQAAQAAVELAKGGIDPATIAAGGLEGALALAAAGELELAEAAGISAKQLGVWGATGVTAANVADLFAQAANASTVDVAELANGMANVGPIAKTMGLSFEETTQAMALLAPGFSSANEAGTSMKNFLARLQPATKSAKIAMMELGLYTRETGSAFFDAQGNFVGVGQASELLAQATANLTNEEKALAFQTIFGNDAMGAAAGFANAGAAGFDAMGESMEGAGTAAEQAAKRNQGYAFAVESLGGSLETLQIVIGSALIPIGTALINNFLIPAANATLEFAQSAIPTMATAWGNFQTSMGPVMATLATVGQALQGLFSILSGDTSVATLAGFSRSLASLFGQETAAIIVHATETMMGWMDSIRAGIPQVSQAFQGFFAILSGDTSISTLSGYAGVLIGLFGQDLALSIFGATAALRGIITTIQELAGQGLAALSAGWAAVQPVLVAVASNGELVRNVLLGIGTALAAFAVITTVVGWVTTLGAAFAAASAAIPTAGAALATVVAILGGPVTIAIAAVSAAIGVLAVAWANNWGDIQGKTQAAITAVSGFISSARTSWEGWWTAHGAQVKAIFNTAWEGIKSLVDGALNNIKTLMSAFQSAREGDWRTFGQKMREIWDGLWESVKRTLNTAIPALLRLITGFADDIVGKFTSVDWGSVGSSIIDGIARGVSSAAQRLIDAAVAAARAALAAVSGFLESKSPSQRAAREIGLPFVQGIALGITDNMSLIQSAAQQAAQMALSGGSMALSPAFAGAGAPGALPFGGGFSPFAPVAPAPASQQAPIQVTIHATINNDMDVEQFAYRVAETIRDRGPR